MSEATAAQLKSLFGILKDRRTVTYSNVAVLTIIGYDILLKMSQEGKVVNSQSPLHYNQVLRSFSSWLMLKKILISRCLAYIWLTSFFGAIVFTTLVNSVLLLRIHALYGRSRRGASKKLIPATFRSTHVYWIFISGIHAGLPFPGCIGQTSEIHLTLVSWVPSLLISVIFFAMTVWKFYMSVRGGGKFFWKRDQKFSPLLIAFVRDGAILFLSLGLLLSILFMVTVYGPLQAAYIPWLLGTYSFSGSRLILNLRESAHKLGNGKTRDDAMSLGVLDFTSNRTRMPVDTLDTGVGI
ncbi:hypothetical protein BDZ94DRAFT_1332819 [Collybia nuda]|uniref:Uncharacterized protein n=1 Tax=Collybia nuda TaxID=64659 RepID=A0A9P6CM74_9AGAR|nr:hypothetical protein BDZ94DRAFT_1332819 [Collybia nuda]